MKSIGQIAFEAWCSGEGSLVPPDALQVAWDRCGESTKAGWERVAAAIKTATMPRGFQRIVAHCPHCTQHVDFKFAASWFEDENGARRASDRTESDTKTAASDSASQSPNGIGHRTE